MANALQFIESNIEDLEKEDVQRVIAQKFLDRVNLIKGQFPRIGELAELYDEQKVDEKHFTFDEMRLVEELLDQADKILLEEVNKDIEIFVRTVKKYSTVKGIRWDDIVFKYEYEVTILPRLLAYINSVKIGPNNIKTLSDYVAGHQDLDLKALELIKGDIEILERPD